MRILSEDEPVETPPIEGEPLTIGRDANRANLIVPSPHVSGVHANLWLNAEGCLVIEDLSSRNGTFVRRAAEKQWHRILAQTTLQVGDTFYLGNPHAAMFEAIHV